MDTTTTSRSWRRWCGALLLSGAAGCACTWDDITSREFKVAALWTRDDPLVILKDSTDNSKRAKAIAALKEPLPHGGAQAEQDRYIQLLEAAALKDHDPLVRMRAIGALGKCKDARAAGILEACYHQNTKYTPEIHNVLKQQVLVSLDQTGGSKALKLLIDVANQPAGAKESPVEAQRVLDERLTAIRLLAKYPQAEAREALVVLLEKEKEVSMQSRVHQSLVTSTGKDLPRDAKVWREFVSSGKTPPPQERHFMAGIMRESPAPLPPDPKAPPEPTIFDRLAGFWSRPDENAIQQTGAPGAPPPAAFPGKKN